MTVTTLDNDPFYGGKLSPFWCIFSKRTENHIGIQANKTEECVLGMKTDIKYMCMPASCTENVQTDDLSVNKRG